MRWRSVAIVVGVLFLVGDVGGILSEVVTGPSLGFFGAHDPKYLTKAAANDAMVIVGSLLLLLMGLSLAAIPIVLFPVLRKSSEVLAIGYVVFRGALETMVTIGMVVCGLVILVVSQQYGAEGGSVLPSLGGLVWAVYDKLSIVLDIVFSLGALMLYTVLYRSRLVPRWLSAWGLVGAVLYLVGGGVGLVGIDGTGAQLILGVQEIVMAVWLIVKGFSPQALVSETSA